MKWFILFVGVIVVCFVVALILGLASGAMSRPTSSLSHEPLPDDPIEDADFDDLTFDVAARGYRMSQVDGVVDRLRRELREKDAEIAVLRGEPPAGPGSEGPRTDEIPAFDVARDLPAIDDAGERPAIEAAGQSTAEATDEREAQEPAPQDEPPAEEHAAQDEPAAEEHAAQDEPPADEPAAEAVDAPATETADKPASETDAEPAAEAGDETGDDVPAAKQPAARGSRARPGTRRRPTT